MKSALDVVDQCVSRYISERRARMGDFIDTRFSVRDAFAIQKKSLLADLLFYPLNALWSIPYLSLKKVIENLDHLGWANLNGALQVIPAGIKTRYQKETERSIAEEFLEIPGFGGRAVRAPKDLMQSLRETKALKNEELSRLESVIASEFLRELDKYSASQALVSDLVGSLMTLIAGRVFFGNGSLGILSMGNRIARKMAHDRAVDHFFLGRSLGSAYYSVVRVEPSRTQVYTATLALGLLLTFFSVLTAVMSDPLRKKMGLHKKKLGALLDSLEERIFLRIKNELKRSGEVG